MKKIFCFVLVAALMLSVAVTAYAADETGKGNWYVHFTPKAEMESNYTDAGDGSMSDIMRGMQPGDTATFYMRLVNQHAESTDWYMTNEVLRTLEESQSMAGGGAYTYRLTYTGPDGVEQVLYTSERVGGANKVSVDGHAGLHEATSSLEDWFYLDTLKTNQSGNIVLYVELEGESQGNIYQQTMAQLQMNFAVELTQTPTTRREFHSVRTGDEQNWMQIWSSVMLVCGLAVLILAVVRAKREKEERGNA